MTSTTRHTKAKAADRIHEKLFDIIEETAVKERPIIFTADSVRAILNGRKTQTRRVAKKFADNVRVIDEVAKGFSPGCPDGWVIPSPYGVPGDRLRVKEAWWQGNGPTWNSHCVVYDADKKHAWLPGSGFNNFDLSEFRKRSPIFMPRWASRITLEITEVRVQRVQEISEEDAQTEGVAMNYDGPYSFQQRFNFRGGYMQLWDSINAKRGFPWDSNPWVWAISFRQMQP